MIRQADHIQDAAKEAESQADNLRSATMSVDHTGDTSKVADVAMSQKKAYERTRQDALNRLELQMQQAEIQGMNMQVR